MASPQAVVVRATPTSAASANPGHAAPPRPHPAARLPPPPPPPPFGEVDRKRPQHRHGRQAEHGVQVIGELVVPVPPPLAQRHPAIGGHLGGAVDVLRDGGQQPVAKELQRIVRHRSLAGQGDDRRAVAPVDRAP